MELNIYHLYPDVLNLYGDRGNILCMEQRLRWRGIRVETTCVCSVGWNGAGCRQTLSRSPSG